mmetsp:Transcript_33637/g.61821  ORF Transcript_33637/g.61821 Transcript_33637/m.61821 type:complete len:224 (-) Transcript_33637:480-1151(-)
MHVSHISLPTYRFLLSYSTSLNSLRHVVSNVPILFVNFFTLFATVFASLLLCNCTLAFFNSLSNTPFLSSSNFRRAFISFITLWYSIMRLAISIKCWSAWSFKWEATSLARTVAVHPTIDKGHSAERSMHWSRTWMCTSFLGMLAPHSLGHGTSLNPHSSSCCVRCLWENVSGQFELGHGTRRNSQSGSLLSSSSSSSIRYELSLLLCCDPPIMIQEHDSFLQ